MSQILPRFYRYQQQQEVLVSVRRAVSESIPEVSVTVARATLPGDRRRLRGIPVAGGASGTSPGTDPVAALLRRRGVDVVRRSR